MKRLILLIGGCLLAPLFTLWAGVGLSLKYRSFAPVCLSLALIAAALAVATRKRA